MVWLIPEALGGLAVSGFLVWLFRRYGARTTWIVASVMAFVAATLFARQWKSVGQTETPLIAEIVVGVVPVLSAALIATTVARRDARVVILVGAVVFVLSLIASALIGTYVLGDVFPL